MSVSDETRHALLDGLVGDHDHLYVTNVHFKTAIDGLAHLLPIWVEGIAGQAVLDARSDMARIEQSIAESIARGLHKDAGR